MPLSPLPPRLEEFKKQLIIERDELLKESREQQAKLDIINAQIEHVSKVTFFCSSVFFAVFSLRSGQASVEAQTKIKEIVPPKITVVEKDQAVMDTTTGPPVVVTSISNEPSS